MHERAAPPAHDVTLLLDCTACKGSVRVVYQKMFGKNGMPISIHNRYTCPHCQHRVEIEIPGLLVPPVLAGH